MIGSKIDTREELVIRNDPIVGYCGAMLTATDSSVPFPASARALACRKSLKPSSALYGRMEVPAYETAL